MANFTTNSVLDEKFNIATNDRVFLLSSPQRQATVDEYILRFTVYTQTVARLV